LKPAEKQPDHTTGWHNPVKSNQLIINWYQQTWHTIEFSNNRHTRHHHNQTTVADRSGATFQTYPTREHFANQRFRHFAVQQMGPRPVSARHKSAVFQAVYQGVGRYLSAPAAATRITLHTVDGPRKSAAGRRRAALTAPSGRASGQASAPAHDRMQTAARQNGLSHINFKDVLCPRGSGPLSLKQNGGSMCTP
jgi:hypothetical protein